MEFGKRWYSYLRHESLELLEKSNLFDCDFTMRPTYLGGSWIKKGVFNIAQYNESREAFITNLISNDFFPCIRGGGNYSLRLYEVMALGKIPIFVDTDTSIPFEDRVDWKKHFLWIESKELKAMPDKLFRIYDQLSGEDFKKWQQRNRELWKEYFSPEGFFKNIKIYLT
jgi:hypothetical protein